MSRSTSSAGELLRPPDRGVTKEAAPVHETIFGAMAAKIVHAAADLGIADLLADGPRTSGELAERAEAHAPSLRRLLLALAALGIVAQTEADRFELTERGRPLQADAPDSLHGVVTMLCGPENWRSWGELVPALRTGERGWDRAHGMTWIEYYGRNPQASATFNRAMAEHSRDAAPGIVAGADLSRFRTIVDVGGGDGTLLAEALRAEPVLEGVVFDLSAGLASAATTLERAGVADRCRVVAGDFFESVPDGADAYVIKQVLHDWNDERAIAILRRLREAMSVDSRLLIVERMLPERVSAADTPVLLLDVLMLLVTGGKERTEREFRTLLDASGLELAALTEPIPPFAYRIIEAAPRGRSRTPGS